MTSRWCTYPGKDAAWLPISGTSDHLPSRYTVIHWDLTNGLRLSLNLGFDGEAVGIRRLTVSPIGDRSPIVPSDMADIRPGYWTLFASRKLWRRADDNDDRMARVRSIYAFHRALGNNTGHPRQAVMEEFGLTRSTASRWIKQAFAGSA